MPQLIEIYIDFNDWLGFGPRILKSNVGREATDGYGYRKSFTFLWLWFEINLVWDD